MDCSHCDGKKWIPEGHFERRCPECNPYVVRPSYKPDPNAYNEMVERYLHQRLKTEKSVEKWMKSQSAN